MASKRDNVIKAYKKVIREEEKGKADVETIDKFIKSSYEYLEEEGWEDEYLEGKIVSMSVGVRAMLGETDPNLSNIAVCMDKVSDIVYESLDANGELVEEDETMIIAKSAVEIKSLVRSVS